MNLTWNFNQIANFITNTTLFVTAQLAALYLSWRLAIVAIPALSMLVVAGFVYAKLLGYVGNKIQAAYEVAGGIASSKLDISCCMLDSYNIRR